MQKMKQSKKAESEVPEGVAAAPLADALAMNGTTGEPSLVTLHNKEAVVQ